jgi:hypothetical protein
MTSDRQDHEPDDSLVSWLTPGIMFGVIGSIASLAALLGAILLLSH